MSQKIQNVVQVSSQMMVEIYKHPLHMAVTRPPRTDVSDVDDVLHLCVIVLTTNRERAILLLSASSVDDWLINLRPAV